MIGDGFTFDQALELIVYPLFDDDGGAESERMYCKQLIQKVHNPLATAQIDPDRVMGLFDEDDDEYPIVDDLLKR